VRTSVAWITDNREFSSLLSDLEVYDSLHFFSLFLGMLMPNHDFPSDSMPDFNASTEVP
jgi:hypothetical protein